MAHKFNALRFKNHRIARGFTLEAFANKLSEEINGNLAPGLEPVKVRPATVYRWETGECTPSERYMFAIPKVLNIKSSELVNAGR